MVKKYTNINKITTYQLKSLNTKKTRKSLCWFRTYTIKIYEVHVIYYRMSEQRKISHFVFSRGCGVMVFNNTFNNFSWRSILLMEETRVPEENHRPAASH